MATKTRTHSRKKAVSKGRKSTRTAQAVKGRKKVKGAARSTTRKTVKKRASDHGLNRAKRWFLGLLTGAAVLAVVTWYSGVKPPTSGTTEVASSASGRGRSSDVFSREFEKAAGRDLAGRMDFWSAFLIDTTNRKRFNETLRGIQPKVEDVVPLIPTAYDCTTYVETVAALARSGDVRQFFAELIKIRYRDGKTDFHHRNHFPVLDWVAENVDSGRLKDVTEDLARLGDVQVATVAKKVDRRRWLAAQTRSGRIGRSIASVASEDWAGRKSEARIGYVALSDIPKMIDRVPDGTIFNLVRMDHPNYDVLISHQGILVRENGRMYMRHASVGGRVRKVDFLNYLNQHKQKRWKVLGVNFNEFTGRG